MTGVILPRKQTSHVRHEPAPLPPDNRHPCGFPTEWKFPLDESKKVQSLTAIRLEAARKQIRHYPTFREQLWNQLRFRSWKHWLLQGFLLLAAMLLAVTLRRQQADSIQTLAACSVFLVFAGNICLGHVAGLFSWHMAELEQTLYLNLKQMVCIRMLEAGIADFAILSLLLILTGGKNPGDTLAALTYMLVPFLWSDTLYLHMLVHLRNTSSGFRSFALGLVCGTLALFPLAWDSAYQPEYLIIWQISAAAGLLMCIAQICRLLGSIENGDNICLN